MERIQLYPPVSNVNARFLQEETPLHNAIESDVESIGQSEPHKAQARSDVPVSASTIMVETSLSEILLAVRQGNQEKVHQLLQNGVNPNELDWHNNGWPALMEAVYYEHVDIAKLLLEHGADPIACNAQGETALHFSLRPQTFVKELVELLISKAKDLDAQEKLYGFSALHVASMICVSTSNEELRTDMMEILKLLSKRSNLNLQNKRRETALHLVASGSSDWAEPAKVLIENGIYLDFRNDRGETSLMCAVDKGYVSIVDILLKNGADVNVGDIHGTTALHIASGKGTQEMVELLLYPR